MTNGEKEPPVGTAPNEETVRAIDEWIDQVQAAEHPLFPTKAERMAAFYAARKRSRQRWQNGDECMFPGCTALSIKRSHTLPRSGPLSLIAEGGHLVSPQVVDGDSIRVLPIGIGEASTFPGFCPTHEGEFHEIDQRKEVDGDRSWMLQFLRTVCWEIRVLEHQLTTFREHAHEYETGLLARANAFLEGRAAAGPRVTKIQRVDWRQELMEEEVNRLESLVASYRREFLEPLQGELTGAAKGDLAAFLIEVPGILPVCLAGRGNFHCRTPEVDVTVPVFLQVFPSANGTKLGMLAAGNTDHHLKSYVAHFAKLNLGPVDTVEAWMVHGTDHWFLRPSVWNHLPADARERLEAEFLDKDLSIGEPTRERIFDRSRIPLVQSTIGK